MPQPKRSIRASSKVRKSQIESTQADPKEVAKVTKAILSKEQAPTSAQMTPDWTTWQAMRDVLGPPFDAERVTVRQMRQLRKDPMIAFGLHFRKVPLVRAEWHIDARDKSGPNAQVAAFVDAAIRQIYARLIFQATLKYDFGFQAISKRWIEQNPGGVYEDATQLDNGLPTTKAVWDEGNVLPKIWKPPVALRPELVQPNFDDKSGEFSGMLYNLPAGQQGATGGSSRGQGKKKSQLEIDVYHAYWATNNKDDEHGSIYGYPTTGFARDYWWAYWFLYHMSNRAYERIAIPPVLAYHPEGNTIVDEESNTSQPNWEIALEMAERLRSNAVAAVPSTMAETGLDSTSGTQRQWDFKFMETPTEALTVFDERFNYLNIMKLRSIWVPELAFMGKETGNTGGNIAAQMEQVFIEGQSIEMDLIDDDINRFWIPQLLLINFPEFVNNGGIARKISHGFRPEDVEFYKQVIQLIGQRNPDDLARVDVVEVFRRMNTPLKSADAFRAEREALAQQATQPGLVPPVAGQSVGVIQNPNVNRGFESGGSAPGVTPSANGGGNGQAAAVAGFSDRVYIQPNEVVGLGDILELSDMEDFLTSLPLSKHYTDKTIRALTVQLRRLWKSHYRRLYPDFAKAVAGLDKFEFSDDGDDYMIMQDGIYLMAEAPKQNGSTAKKVAAGAATVIVTKKAAEKAAKAIMDKWVVASDVLSELSEKTAKLLRKMLERAVKLDLKEANIKATLAADAFDDFIEEQTGRLIKLTGQTTKDELRSFLVARMREDKSPKEIADAIRDHFDGISTTHADRIARSETRDAVNAATLISGEAASIKYTRAVDGEDFDEDCADRNGKLFTIKEAWKEMRKEHPNGTLGFQLIPRVDFSIKYVEQMPDEHEGQAAYFDNDTGTAFVVFGESGTEDYLTALGAQLVKAPA